MHTTNPHNPPAPSGYTDADFHTGQRVWLTLEPEPVEIIGREYGAWVVRATDGVVMNATAAMMSPAADDTATPPAAGS